MIESNGKKRVFITDDLKEKLAKYAKARVNKGNKKAKSKVKIVKVRVIKKEEI